MKVCRSAALGLLLLAALAVRGQASGKKPGGHPGQYLVLLRDGLAAGLCANHAAPPGRRGEATTPPLRVRIEGDNADYRPEAGFLAAMTHCGSVTPEPLPSGEVLRVRRTGYRRDTLFLMVETVSPHTVARGLGPYAELGYEPAAAEFDFPHCRQAPDECFAAEARWFRVFQSRAEAARFAEARNQPAVRHVKTGMTFAEVEAALGPPVTKVDLGAKVLYKYPDLTVEFHDGKVADAK